MTAAVSDIWAWKMARLRRKGAKNMQRLAETLTVDPLALQAYVDKIEQDCVARAEHLERMAEMDTRDPDGPPPSAA